MHPPCRKYGPKPARNQLLDLHTGQTSHNEIPIKLTTARRQKTKKKYLICSHMVEETCLASAAMDAKTRDRIQLNCLYDMFRDRVEENVIYIVYTENECKIEATIDQLMSIAACSLTGYYFEPQSSSGTKRATSLDAGRRQAKSAGQSLNVSRTLSPSSSGLTRNATVRVSKPHSNSLTSNGVSAKSSESSESERGADEELEQNEEQLDIDERISRCQKSIEQLLAEKASCHEKASQYLNKKMYQVTSYYSELSGQCRRMIETRTRKLIDLLLLKSENANTIDLHGLNPVQAKLVVSELLNIRQNQLSIDKQGETNIDIITGWGKHTVKTGQHRIRPTIVALLKDKGYHFYHLNKGALRVTIRR